MRLFRAIDAISEIRLKRFQAKLDVVKTIFSGFTLLSVIGAGIGLWFQYHTLAVTEEREAKTDERDRQEILRRTRESAQNIINGWDDRTSRVKSEVESELRRLGQKAPEMDKTAAIHIWYATEDQKREWATRLNVTSLLNYFESVATAYERNIGQKDMLEDSLAGPMMDWRKHLKYYTALADCVRHHQTWAPYYRVVDVWIDANKHKQGARGRFFEYFKLPDLSDACPGSDDGKIRTCCEAALMQLQ